MLMWCVSLIHSEALSDLRTGNLELRNLLDAIDLHNLYNISFIGTEYRGLSCRLPRRGIHVNGTRIAYTTHERSGFAIMLLNSTY